MKEIEASSAEKKNLRILPLTIFGRCRSTRFNHTIAANPILDLVRGYGYQGGPILAQFAKKDMDKVKGYLDLPAVRKLLPSTLRYVTLLRKTQSKCRYR